MIAQRLGEKGRTSSTTDTVADAVTGRAQQNRDSRALDFQSVNQEVGWGGAWELESSKEIKAVIPKRCI